MALTFNGTTSKLEIADALVSSREVSIFAWVKPANTNNGMVAGMGDNGGDDAVAIYFAGATDGKVWAFEREPGSSTKAASTESFAASTWKPVIVEFLSSVNRRVYFDDDLDPDIDTTSKSATFSNFDRFVVGTYPKSDSIWFEGDVAHVAVWDTRLGPGDWELLRQGADPLTVHPTKLVEYWTLETQASTQTGEVASKVLTATNTSQAANDPTIDGTLPVDFAEIAWSWFSRPAAVYKNGATYLGGVNRDGDVMVYKYTHATGAVESFTLSAALGFNDHNAPSLVFDPDDKLVCFYADHNSSSNLLFRKATTAESISAFGSETTAVTDDGGGIIYSNPHVLSTSGYCHILFRDRNGSGIRRWKILSTADFSAFSTVNFIDANPDSATASYFIAADDGVSKLHIVYTDKHPVNATPNPKIYHIVATDDGAGNLSFAESDGTAITTSMAYSDGTLVYDGTTGSNCWIWDLQLDGSGNPRLLFVRFESTTDHRLMFTRWNGTSWTTPVQVAAMGNSPIPTEEAYYSGGGCFEDGDTDVVYVSIESAGDFVVKKYTTADNGASWSEDSTLYASSESTKLRPVSPKDQNGELPAIWLAGYYADYNNFQMAAVGPVHASSTSATTLNPCAESDQSIALTASKAQTLAPAIESDQSVSIDAASAVLLSPATEGDQSVAIAAGKSQTLAHAQESDTSPAAVGSKAETLGIPGETDSAVPVSTSSGITLTPAVETDSALALTSAKAESLAPATESDTSLPVSFGGATTLLPATESDSVPAMSSSKSDSLGVATEADSAPTVSTSTGVTLSPAVETDSVPALSSGKYTGLTAALEADSSVPVTLPSGVTLLPAYETDTVPAASWPSAVTLGVATETDSSVAIDVSCPDEENYPAFDRSRRRVLRSVLRRHGEEVVFTIGAGTLPVQAVLDWDVPEQPIGTQRHPRPKPYLLVRQIDVGCANIDANDTVELRGITATVVSEPMKDGEGWYRIYVRGNF